MKDKIEKIFNKYAYWEMDATKIADGSFKYSNIRFTMEDEQYKKLVKELATLISESEGKK